MDGVEGRSGMWRVVARILFSVIVAIAATLCGFDSVSAGSGNGATAKPTLRIGSTNFTEQLIVAELYAQALEANGAQAEAVEELRRFLVIHPNQPDQREFRRGAEARLRALGAKP